MDVLFLALNVVVMVVGYGKKGLLDSIGPWLPRQMIAFEGL